MIEGIYGEKGKDKWYIEFSDGPSYIIALIVDSKGIQPGNNVLFSIHKETGCITLFEHVNKEFGFDLGPEGTLKHMTER